MSSPPIQLTERLITASNSICNKAPRQGASDQEIVWIKELFAEWSFPLPSELLLIWRITAGLPRHVYDQSLIKTPFGMKSLDVAASERLTVYDIERYEILNLGNGYGVSLTINRDGRVSLDAMDFDIQPESFPYEFIEGYSKYVEAIEAEVANGCYEPEEG